MEMDASRPDNPQGMSLVGVGFALLLFFLWRRVARLEAIPGSCQRQERSTKGLSYWFRALCSSPEVMYTPFSFRLVSAVTIMHYAMFGDLNPSRETLIIRGALDSFKGSSPNYAIQKCFSQPFGRRDSP